MLAGTETHIPYLSSNQEEADDRIMYHINDGVVKHGVQSVFVDSPDTDVFVILFFTAKTLGIYRSKVGPKLSGIKSSVDLPLLDGFGVEELSARTINEAEQFVLSALKKTDCSTFDEYLWEQYHN